jgi:transcriptional regulator with XRE-family HTH domain
MPFAKKLRELRKQHKWSQDELASKVGVHGRHIGKYENGQVMPNTDTLIRIAKVFDVSLDYLVLDIETPKLENLFDKDVLGYLEKLSGMGDKDKEVIKSLLEAYVKKRQVEAIIAR